MRKELDVTWNWDEIFIMYCTKNLSFENIAKEYREKHNDDGPAVGTIFNRSKAEKWKDRRKKWIAEKQDSQLQEIKKLEVAEFRKNITVINTIIEKVTDDVLAKLSIPKTKIRLEETGEVITVSRYDGKIKDLDRLFRLKKMLLEGDDKVKSLTLTLNYPVKNMSDQDKADYDEFVRNEFNEKAIDVPFVLIEPDDEEDRIPEEDENDSGTE